MSTRWSIIKARGQIARGVRPTYHVSPEPDGRRWVLRVPELDRWSQAERLEGVDVPANSFDIVVEPIAGS
ncbi:MAG: hypothetical protein ACXWMN_04350 [Candidatus Limnocylindria bacterium]